MPTFKYTVANQEGKHLSGVVEAVNKETARQELNQLGFSVITLEVTTQFQTPENPEQSKTPRFVFEAIDKQSRSISGTVPAQNKEEAFRKLKAEYDLTVTALWPENADQSSIATARQEGTNKLQEQLRLEEEQVEAKNHKLEIEKKREEAFTRAKIESILRQVNELLQNYNQYFDQDQQKLIHNKIDKVLRIKNSTNLTYILQSAEDLLHSIQEQEEKLREKGLQEKQISLAIETRNLLGELKKNSKPKTLSEDILRKIDNWENQHNDSANFFTRWISGLLIKVKNFLHTPEEIKVLKEQISTYNKQIIDFIFLYFKESGAEYRSKITNSIKTVWHQRAKAKQRIAEIKKLAKQNQSINTEEDFSLLKEINTISGFFLAVYILYYFVGIYLDSKDFGIFLNIQEVPAALKIYETAIFKHVLALLFLLHCATALKTNFFLRNSLASLIIFPVCTLLSIISILNF